MHGISNLLMQFLADVVDVFATLLMCRETYQWRLLFMAHLLTDVQPAGQGGIGALAYNIGNGIYTMPFK